MTLDFKISFFLHILSAMLIAIAAFGLPVIEAGIRKNLGKESIALHGLSLTFSNFARFGGVLALLTGIYNWIKIGGFQGWLLVKVVLFLWFVVSGIIVGIRYFSKRGEMLNRENFDVGEVSKLNVAIKNYSYVNIVVFVLIVFLAVSKPF